MQVDVWVCRWMCRCASGCVEGGLREVVQHAGGLVEHERGGTEMPVGMGQAMQVV